MFGRGIRPGENRSPNRRRRHIGIALQHDETHRNFMAPATDSGHLINQPVQSDFCKYFVTCLPVNQYVGIQFL